VASGPLVEAEHRPDVECMNSRIPRFYELQPDDRLAALVERGLLTEPQAAQLRNESLTLQAANLMIENVVGTFGLPNAVAVNFMIDGRDRVVPMVVEEPSVLAAVSNMARVARTGGGFFTDVDQGVMIGQVHIPAVTDPEACVRALEDALPQLRQVAEGVHPRLEERGGGLRDFVVRRVRYDEPGHPQEDMVVLHFHLDCVDAMGANMVNTIAEHLAPHVEQITGMRVGLRILSNLADKRLARARVRLNVSDLASDPKTGFDVACRIAEAWRFAWADPYRATTHNKGVMNGIDAVALATGNDWRAIEAGAHAFAARSGQYRPLTRWTLEGDHLMGQIEVPLQMGTVGGAMRIHPTVQANLALMGAETARDLSSVAAAVGLAQNLGALRALATEGIQQGHMRMHARIVAANAGAEPHEIAEVVHRLGLEQEFSLERARNILETLRMQDPT
jgi:hydroxymethylglutaryl-CoA reductase